MQFKDYQELKPPIILAQRYQVANCLHSGSASTVFLCRDLKTPARLLALKTLSKKFPRTSSQAKRIREEMLLSMSIEHPNIVRVLDYIEEPDFVGFSMEFAPGGDLALFLSQYHRLSISHAVDLILQVARGLCAIHSAGLIHRDLKPENILIFGEREFKIADFGIASLLGNSSVFDQEELECTPHYVSPEMLQTGEVTPKLDLYSLGVVAYEALTGLCPYNGAGSIETLRKHLTLDLVPPSQLVGQCPEVLSKIVMRLLARDPSDRFDSALELVEELNFFKRTHHLEVPSPALKLYEEV